MTNELTYWLAFSLAEGIVTKRKNEILAICHKANLSVVDFMESSEETWRDNFMLNDDEVCKMTKAKQWLSNAAFQVDDLISQGFSLIPIMSEHYPTTLKKYMKYASPVLLYAKGDISMLNQPSVAIVGCRAANSTSLSFTDTIAKACVEQGLVIVSGGAKGVDRQALDSALKYGGRSILVLPQGIKTYSSGFRSLYKDIVTGKVLVISSFAPTAPWSVGLAMARNKIVYGLSRKIYVAESNTSGGTYEGVVDGLKNGHTIYVRKPGQREKNANMELAGKGAILVDMDGNPVPQKDDSAESGTLFQVVENVPVLADSGERDKPETKLLLFLSRGWHTIKEMSSHLYGNDEERCRKKARAILAKLKGDRAYELHTRKSGRSTMYKIGEDYSQDEPNLWGDPSL